VIWIDKTISVFATNALERSGIFQELFVVQKFWKNPFSFQNLSSHQPTPNQIAASKNLMIHLNPSANQN
jgi:hypothetical protein